MSHKNGVVKQCEFCGKSVYLKLSRIKRFRFCSQSCLGKKTSLLPNSGRFKKGENIGENHPNWKGGTVLKSGYKQIYRNGKIVLEHRLVMEEHIGRELIRGEQVHHINHVRSDNRIENLMIIDIREHGRIHTQERWDKLKLAR